MAPAIEPLAAPDPGWPRLPTVRVVPRWPWPRILGAVGFRLACFALMNALAVWVEARPAPSLPDALLSRIPYVPVVDRYNYLLWAVAYLPIAFLLLARDPRRFIRYNFAAGGLALLRGLCIAATGLGPVHGADLHAGMSGSARVSAFVALVTLNHFGAAPFALTKDLFFSGHTSTTLLLLLYVWRDRLLRGWALVGHVGVVATVFLAHLHYTIDVLGAYAVTLALFALLEADWRPALR